MSAGTSETTMGARSDLLVCIDVDRTILNTTHVFELSVQALAQLGVDTDVVQTIVRDEAKFRGNAFDFISEVHARSGIEVSLEDVVAQILHNIAQNGDTIDSLFADGTEHLIDVVRSIGAKALLLTYGGIHTQRMKLMLVEEAMKHWFGQDEMMPWMILSRKGQYKTQCIADAYDDASQQFDISALANVAGETGNLEVLRDAVLHEAVMLDDKEAEVAATASEHVRGILIAVAEQGDDQPGRTTLREAAKILHSE